MDVYVLSAALHPAADAISDKRLEEYVQRTSRTALDEARVARSDLDHVTLAACDELDGKSITSMLMAAPAGAYLRDEMRVTDSGLAGLHLGAMRIAAGDLHLGLVVSWNQTSVGPIEDIARIRAEPFYLRPIGMNISIADGLFANAVSHCMGFDAAAAAARVQQRLKAATRNPRAIARAMPSADDIERSNLLAHPLRDGHRPRITDGAVAMVLASGDWVRSHPDCKPLARIAATSWAVDSYRLDTERLSSLETYRNCLADVLRRAGLASINELDVFELEAQTAWYDLAFTQAAQDEGANDKLAVSPSGGAWAQNPLFCTSLVNAVEAIFQVAGRSGAHQVPGAKRAMAHGTNGFAQQAHGFAIFEGMNV